MMITEVPSSFASRPSFPATSSGCRTSPALEVGSMVFGDVLLAPLSGITDVPFRTLARRFGTGLAFSEMVASGEFVAGDLESSRRAAADGQGVHAVQLAGRDPRLMKSAAEKLAECGVELIDINMGCPAKKVVGGLSGSALMRDPDLALRIVEATVAGARDVPVTLKMRLGWDGLSINAPQIARSAEAAGVRMITVHGRTRMQFYDGSADWKAIAAVKRMVTVPVVANGDLVNAADEGRMRADSGCDAVMIGRGACGRPWFPGLISGRISFAELGGISFGEMVVEHYEAMLSHYGASAGVRQARKHLGWYLDALSHAVGVRLDVDRSAILRGEDGKDVARRLSRICGSISIAHIESRLSERPRAEAA